MSFFQNLERRLFADEVLYCEGGHKPYLRGKIHMVWCFAAIPGAYFLYTECRGNYYQLGIAMISLGTNLLCFGWSAMFHVGSWSKPIEIAFQKLDHCMISLWCVGMMFPTGLLILPRLTEYNGFIPLKFVPLGIIMIGLAAGFCCMNCWYTTLHN